ncbi:hypothetical protein N431DRAFT_396177, partial [Stipitochalara longipes BDJ]
MNRNGTDRMEYAEPSPNAASSHSASPHPSLDGELRQPGFEEPYSISGVGRRHRQCPFCPRAFSKHEHLARHLRSHTKEKPFECSICDKRFGRHDTLLRHVRSHSATRRNKSAKQIINTRSVDVVSPTPQDSGELSHISRPGILETGSSVVDNGGAANTYNALAFSHGEDESRSTYSSTNMFNQGELAMNASNSTISPSFGLQPRSYTSTSLENDSTQSLWSTMPLGTQTSSSYHS